MFIVNPFVFSQAAFPNTYSMLFDGVNERFDHGILTDADGASTYSVSLWVKFGTLSGNHHIFGNRVDSSNWAGAYQTGSSIRFYLANGAVKYGSFTPSLSTGTWYHFAFVFDGGGSTNSDRLKIYFNGSNQTLSFSGSIPGTWINFTSGFPSSNYTQGAASGGTFPFSGNIDEICTFNYALSGTQVSNLYNSGTPTDPLSTSGVTAPTHYWRNGDDVGDTWSGSAWTINDIGTAGGNNGTSVNMEEADRVTDVP